MYKCLFNDENVTNDDHFVALVYDFIFVAFDTSGQVGRFVHQLQFLFSDSTSLCRFMCATCVDNFKLVSHRLFQCMKS